MDSVKNEITAWLPAPPSLPPPSDLNIHSEKESRMEENLYSEPPRDDLPLTSPFDASEGQDRIQLVVTDQEIESMSIKILLVGFEHSLNVQGACERKLWISDMAS